MKNLYLIILIVFISNKAIAQCPANVTNVYSFSIGTTNYEIVKENRTWTAAAACAVARGGYLAEINSLAEQNAIFAATSSAGITTSNTTAPDGGGAAYLWIGGNDINTEGTWVWDGNNDNVGTTFYMGTGAAGSPVGAAYNNWGSSGFGSEPDNFGSGQDGLGLAITNWPLGMAGQWNDVSDGNSLYYIIEGINIPLNIEITDFVASVNNSGKVQLNWKTNEERQFYTFEIERSTNGTNFETIGIVTNSSRLNTNDNYEYIDAYTMRLEKVYYRLKLISQDQNVVYSSILGAKLLNKENNQIQVSQNGMITRFYFQERHTSGKLVVYNSVGSKIRTISFEENDEFVQIDLNTTGLFLYNLYFHEQKGGEFFKGKFIQSER